MGLSLRFHGDQGVATELPLRFVAILRGILVGDACDLTVLPLHSLRSHGVLTVLPLHSLRSHGVLTVLPPPSLQSHGVLTVLLAIVWRFHGALVRMLRDNVCFAHTQNKHSPSAFCCVLCDLTTLPRRCLRSHCSHLGVLQFSDFRVTGVLSVYTNIYDSSKLLPIFRFC